MPARPNKRRRALDKLARDRAKATAIRSTADAERRPLVGCETHYEITRTGDVWSNRLSRYIKHTFNPSHGSTFIRVRIQGQEHTLSVWRAVAEAWLTVEQRAEILAELPAGTPIGKLPSSECNDRVNRLAKAYGVPSHVIYGILATRAD